MIKFNVKQECNNFDLGRKKFIIRFSLPESIPLSKFFFDRFATYS